MKECPKCKRQTLDDDEVLNNLSIVDNSTYICPECADKEDAEGLLRGAYE